MATSAMAAFPPQLRWSLLTAYVVLTVAGVIAVIAGKPITYFFTGYGEFLVAIVLLVQLVAVIVAISLLVRDVRNRSVANLLTTFAGALPIFFFVVAVMSGNVRVHM